MKVNEEGTGNLEVETDPLKQGLVPQGGYLCFLDTSPKLPSSLLANHVSDRVKALSGPDQTLNVLLIREKVSKLSETDMQVQACKDRPRRRGPETFGTITG